MGQWVNLHITDKSGEKMFRGIHSPMSAPGQIRELKRHIWQAKKTPTMYPFMDADTAVVVVNGEPLVELADIPADDLLRELGE